MYKDNSPCASIRSMSLSIKPLAVAAAVFALAGQAHAAVNGGTVAAGAATINANGTTTTINQSTDRAVINWNSFDIGANEKVQINQPASTSAILNRVNSTSGTRIDGELNANGRVFVVNPNGIVVGESGKINANGVTLSTLDVSDANFMQPLNGQMGEVNALSFRRGAALEARVVNDGTITAAEGGISLFGGQVINSATGNLSAKENAFLSSNVNSVNMIAADAIDVSQDAKSLPWSTDTGLRLLSLNASSGASNLVINDGAIAVQNGLVTVRAASNAGKEAVRNTGSIDSAYFTTPPLAAMTGVDIRSDNGSVYVDGSINSASLVTLMSNNGPLTVDGSIAAGSIGLRATGNANILIDDRADVSGSSISINSDNNVLINGRLAAAQSGAVDIYARTISVNGSVSGGYVNFGDQNGTPIGW